MRSLGGKTPVPSALTHLEAKGSGFPWHCRMGGGMDGKLSASLPVWHCQEIHSAHIGMLVSASSSEPPKWESYDPVLSVVAINQSLQIYRVTSASGAGCAGTQVGFFCS